jgi:outer membrane receptor protein involved in Fe transport
MKLPTPLLLLGAAFVTLPLTRAQTPPPPGSPARTSATSSPLVQLEPLRVTGDLWESPLERIPASVSVYDDRALLAGSVRHFGDLADQIPNLTWSGGTSRPRYFQIRGIGENSQYEGETPDSTVRFVVDDLDFTGLGSLGGTFDVRQVEILRGPQAGAFGANAAAGVVRLVTNAPTPFWTGQIEATAGNDGLREGGIAVGGPLGRRAPESLMMRLALHRHTSDGFRRNVTLNRDANARDEMSARLRLTANLSPQWRWDAAVLWADVNNGFDEFALDNNGERTFSDQPGSDQQRSHAGSLRGAFTGLAGMRFTTTSNASRTKSRYSYDDDWTSASYQGFSDIGRERRVFNQELRLDSTATRDAAGLIDRWTVGGFFSSTVEDTAYTNEDPGNLRALDTTYEAANFALFGQVSHDLSSRTRLVIGVRAEHLDLNGTGTRSRFRRSSGTRDPVVSFQPGFEDELFGGKLTLEHDLGDRQLGFVSITRGYKAGGVNIDARISPPADPLTYATEYLWNYEAGLRGNWLGQRLLGEITVFALQRHNTQVRDSAGFGGSYRFFTANAERSHVYGFEASGSLAVSKTWSLHAALAQMESSLDRFTLANANTGGGRRLANTPRHGYTLGSRYRASGGFFANLEFVGRSRQFDSNNHDEARSAFNVVNGSIGYSRGPWTFTIWVRNLFDERYEKRVFFFGNEDPDYVPSRYETRADPRQLGVTANYRF